MLLAAVPIGMAYKSALEVRDLVIVGNTAGINIESTPVVACITDCVSVLTLTNTAMIPNTAVTGFDKLGIKTCCGFAVNGIGILDATLFIAVIAFERSSRCPILRKRGKTERTL